MDDQFPTGMVEEIERILKLRLPPGQLVYEEVFASTLMFPLQRKGELRRMMEIATKREPKVVMEIGCDKGGGLYHWCQVPTVRTVYASEIRGTPYDRFWPSYFLDIHFYWGGDSEAMFKATEATVRAGGTIDCLFIDGDKGRFYEDFELYHPLMSANGIVFFHDVQDPGGPREAFEKVRKGRRSEVIIDKTDWESVKDVVASVLPLTAHQQWLRHWKGRSCGVGVVYLP